MHVERDGDQVLGNRLADDIALLVVRVLYELLAEVIAKRIRHEVGKVAERLVEDDVAMLWDTLLKLLLEVATAVLILAKRRDLALQVLKASTSEAIDCGQRSREPRKTSTNCYRLTLAIDVAALVLGTVEAVHLVVRSTAGAAATSAATTTATAATTDTRVDIAVRKTVASAVVMIERGGACNVRRRLRAAGSGIEASTETTAVTVEAVRLV